MCVQYRGGAQYCGGCSVPWGDIMTHVGGCLEYRKRYSVPWRYHDKCGGYLEYHGGYSLPWGYMIHMGYIMSTVGGTI